MSYKIFLDFFGKCKEMYNFAIPNTQSEEGKQNYLA
jgi:hypothetical protein